jgi:TolB-like protein
MRLSVRLVRTEDALQVWNTSYDRTAQDLLPLQEEIATQVATSIAGRLFPAERASLAAQPTRNPQAYDHF